MKSSTLRRSNLSRERMAVLEELSRRRRQALSSDAPQGVQNSREKELDVLWENFKVSQRNDKSPSVYLLTGFIAGVLATLVMITLLNFTISKTEVQPQDYSMPKDRVKKEKLTFIPSDKGVEATVAVASKTENYTVKEGDTLESIIIRFYGSFDLNKVEKIREANAMANPNALSIGQKLIIPME